MSAAEIIELIKKLSPEERAQVVAFFKTEPARREVKYISDEGFEAAAKEVFEDHKELFRRLAEYEREERR